MALIRVHNCQTDDVIDRPRMAAEQAAVDAERAAAAQRPAPVDKLADLEARIAALERR